VSDIEIGRADARDFPGILELARRALRWTDDDASFLEWKHMQNPFGVSPMWIARADDRVVGFRTFLRWEFETPDGRTVRAARAVDTATDPDHQGRGIFTRLTRAAIEELPNDGVELIFNTPNEKSLPGYLKMGWSEVGRLPVALMPTSWRFPLVVGRARQAAGRLPLTTTAGEPASEVFLGVAVDELLAVSGAPAGLRTARDRDYFLWRYGNELLGYRVVFADLGRPSRGFAVFRRRRRGDAVEAVLCDVVVPEGGGRIARGLARTVARVADADYVLRIDRRVVTTDPFVQMPRIGPVLACRPLDGSAAPGLRGWSLTMGDVELF
jgi:GNAT superfamily N-acetyltransferase